MMTSQFGLKKYELTNSPDDTTTLDIDFGLVKDQLSELSRQWQDNIKTVTNDSIVLAHGSILYKDHLTVDPKQTGIDFQKHLSLNDTFTATLEINILGFYLSDLERETILKPKQERQYLETIYQYIEQHPQNRHYQNVTIGDKTLFAPAKLLKDMRYSPNKRPKEVPYTEVPYSHLEDLLSQAERYDQDDESLLLHNIPNLKNATWTQTTQIGPDGRKKSQLVIEDQEQTIMTITSEGILINHGVDDKLVQQMVQYLNDTM